MSGKLTEIVDTSFGPWICLCNDHNMASRRAGNLGHDKETNWLRKVLSGITDPVFLDVGAHNGLFCLRLYDLCSQIHAWEPQRLVFNLLAGTVALNSWTHVLIHPEALGDHIGEVPIPTYDYSKSANFGGVWLGELAPEKQNVGQLRGDWNGELVTIRTLDSYALQRVDVIKIDVEGMELEVLNGSLETIRRYQPRLLVEHVVTGIGPLKNWLEREGYACSDLGGDLACEPTKVKETI